MSGLFFIVAAGLAAAAVIKGRALSRDLAEYAAKLDAGS